MKNNSQLKQFQIEALWAYHLKKDCIVIQATGSGKSTCFHIPAMMLKENQIGLIVVPTVALGEDHKQTLEEMGVRSVFLKGSSDKKEYQVILHSSEVVSNPEQASTPAVVIMLPEFLFGNDNHKGIIERIDTNRVKFITLDEAHLTFEWVSFRKSFGKLEDLKDTFTCPIMALSATMKPKHLSAMCSGVLRNPVILKGTVERSNVDIHIVPYQHSSKKEMIADEVDDWFATAEQIVEIIGKEKTIVYCSFASECDLLKSNFLKLGVKCDKYTGRTTSAKDKIAVYKKVKVGDIQLLVATKAFGMGINLPDIRHIFNVGMPENLSLWLQEYGRAGRDGNQANAYMLINENLDMKRFAFWKGESKTDEDKLKREEELVEVFQYMCNAYAGKCLRTFQSLYFQDEVVASKVSRFCCTGCEIVEKCPPESVKELQILLKAFTFLKRRGIPQVFENRISSWLYGDHEDWMNMFFNQGDAEQEPTFGCLSSQAKCNVVQVVKVLLRQAFALEYLSMKMETLPGKYHILTRTWTITDLGVEIGNKDPPKIPEPIKVYACLKM